MSRLPVVPRIGKLLRGLALRASKGKGVEKQTGLDKDHPLIRFFGKDGETVENYLLLDDALIVGALGAMTLATDPVISELATRLRERRIFRAKRIATRREEGKGRSMIEREEYVAAIVDAAGGRLVSRIRLQKIAYLLEQLGLESGFDYQYHHYGPYSRDLDNAILDAEAFDYLEEKFDRRQSDGARYSIFKIKKSPESDVFRHLGASKAQQVIRKLADTNVTVLELAATAHWLAAAEKVSDWRKEIVRRKGPKTESGRLDKALQVLRDLGLPPAHLTAT